MELHYWKYLFIVTWHIFHWFLVKIKIFRFVTTNENPLFWTMAISGCLPFITSWKECKLFDRFKMIIFCNHQGTKTQNNHTYYILSVSITQMNYQNTKKTRNTHSLIFSWTGLLFGLHKNLQAWEHDSHHHQCHDHHHQHHHLISNLVIKLTLYR